MGSFLWWFPCSVLASSCAFLLGLPVWLSCKLRALICMLLSAIGYVVALSGMLLALLGMARAARLATCIYDSIHISHFHDVAWWNV